MLANNAIFFIAFALSCRCIILSVPIGYTACYAKRIKVTALN